MAEEEVTNEIPQVAKSLSAADQRPLLIDNTGSVGGGLLPGVLMSSVTILLAAFNGQSVVS